MKQFLNLSRLGFHGKKHLSKAQKKGRTREFIAKLSKGIMLPISMLPIAGIFLGVGSAISSNSNGNNALNIFGNFLSAPGNAVFGSLALLFAIAIAIAFTGDSGPAALASFVAFLVFSAIQSALAIQINAYNANGASVAIGYDFLFYKSGSLGAVSPVVPSYVPLTSTVDGTARLSDVGFKFNALQSILNGLNMTTDSAVLNAINGVTEKTSTVSQITNVKLTGAAALANIKSVNLLNINTNTNPALNSTALFITPANAIVSHGVPSVLSINVLKDVVKNNTNIINSDTHLTMLIGTAASNSFGNLKIKGTAFTNSAILTSLLNDLSSGSVVTAGLQPSLFSQVAGLNQLTSSVFGGILVGFTVAFLYNRYYKIKLPLVLGFFSGVRFIPIISFLVFFPLTIIFSMLWPLVGTFLYFIGQALGNTLGINSFIFGYVERALVPFGLHHAFYAPLWYTAAGGQADFTAQAVIYRGGQAYALSAHNVPLTSIITWQQLVQDFHVGNNSYNPGTIDNPNNIGGDSYTFVRLNKNLLGQRVDLYPVQVVGNFNQIGNNTYEFLKGVDTEKPFATNAPLTWADLTGNLGSVAKGANGFGGVNIGQYLQGKYVFMITALPAACAGMIMAAPRENRKTAASVLVSAAFTSFLTGITEPIEFTFLFLAPWLYWGIHAVFCAFAFGIMNWIGLIVIAAGAPGLAPHIGQTFSGGILDWVIYGGIQIQYQSNAWWSWIFAVPWAFMYYFVWYILVKRFNIPTPGREGNVNKLYTKADYIAKKVASELNLQKDQLLALNVVGAYGGFDNIKNVDACITKLRVEVGTKDVVDSQRLISLGAKGTINPSPSSVYAVFGVEADIIKNNIKDLMKTIEADPSMKQKYMDALKGVELTEQASKGSEKSDPSTDTTSPPLDSELAQERLIVRSPVMGTIVPKDEIEDDTFKNDLVGLGVALKPLTNDFVAPIDGKLSMVFNTEHAYTFESAKGSQIMVHIGIDSINIKDDSGNVVNPFKSNVKSNDPIKLGDKFTTVDLSKLKYAKSNTTPVVILHESLAGREVKILKTSGVVKKGDPLFEVVPKKS